MGTAIKQPCLYARPG